MLVRNFSQKVLCSFPCLIVKKEGGGGAGGGEGAVHSIFGQISPIISLY